MLLRHPSFAITLINARSRYFATRAFREPIETPDGFKIETFQELIAYWSFFVERESWSSEWVSLLKNEAKPVVLDVGANAGLFTHLVWTMNRDATIFSFDPLPAMAEKIRAWQGRTGANATVFNLAVADRSGTAEFFAVSERDTTASLKADGNAGQALTVQVATLDEVLPAIESVSLMKVDVEGAEPEVLAGAKRVLGRTKYLIMEAHTTEALRKIQMRLGADWKTKKVGASDFLFFRS